MNKTKIDQIKAAAKKAPEGWTFDAELFLMHNIKQVYVDSIANEEGVFFRAKLRYFAERIGTGYLAKETGKQIPTLSIYKYSPIQNSDTLFHVENISDEYVGEIQKRRNYNYLCKLAGTIDVETLFDSAILQNDVAESEEPQEDDNETTAGKTVNTTATICEGMIFADNDGKTYTITALSEMSVEINKGEKAMIDFGTRRTVQDVIDSLFGGRLIFDPREADTATAEEPAEEAEEQTAQAEEDQQETAEKESEYSDVFATNPTKATFSFPELAKAYATGATLGEEEQEPEETNDAQEEGHEVEEKTYKYGMKYRGFSIGCQPSAGFMDRIDDPTGKYFDILEYNRELTAEELRDYELEPIVDGANTDTDTEKLEALKQAFQSEYSRLYDGSEDPTIMQEQREASARFDELDESNELLVAFCKYRGDFISSNREAAAYIIAVDKISLKSDAKEEKEPAVKEKPEESPESAPEEPEEKPTESATTNQPASDNIGNNSQFAALAAAYVNKKVLKVSKSKPTPAAPQADTEPEEPQKPNILGEITGSDGVTAYRATTALNADILERISPAGEIQYIIISPENNLDTLPANIHYVSESEIDVGKLHTETIKTLCKMAGIVPPIGYTGQQGEILTPEEIAALQGGRQVKKHILSYNMLYIATPYNDKTLFVYKQEHYTGRNTEVNIDEIQLKPDEMLIFAGFITGNKYYTDFDKIKEEYKRDVENRLMVDVPDEKTALKLSEGCSEWQTRENNSYIKQAEDVEHIKKEYFYKEKQPRLSPLVLPDKKISNADAIEYIENPEKAITDRCVAYESDPDNMAKVYGRIAVYNREVATLAAIMGDKDSDAHKVKLIMDCIHDEKTVRVTISNGNTVRIGTFDVKRIGFVGYITSWDVVAADRKYLDINEYNRPADILPEDIIQIKHGSRILYEKAT